MQHQTVPQSTGSTYRIAFDTVLGVEPLTVPAVATADEIAKQIEVAFADADVPRAITASVDLAEGQATLTEVYGDGPFEWASITRVDEQPATQDQGVSELTAMLRHAAEHYGMHHIAALNEIRVLTRTGMTDEEFRVKTIEILNAVEQVDEEIDAATEAGAR